MNFFSLVVTCVVSCSCCGLDASSWPLLGFSWKGALLIALRQFFCYNWDFSNWRGLFNWLRCLGLRIGLIFLKIFSKDDHGGAIIDFVDLRGVLGDDDGGVSHEDKQGEGGQANHGVSHF